jgi:hypothetical protein
MTDGLTRKEIDFLRELEYSPYSVEELAEAVCSDLAEENGNLIKVAGAYLQAQAEFQAMLEEINFKRG